MTIKKKTVHVDEEEYKKFIEKYPSHGAFTWWINVALKRFNEQNAISPEELIGLAMKEVDLRESE